MPKSSNPRYYSIKVVPAREPDYEASTHDPCPVFNPVTILTAAGLGILAALFSNLGAAAAGGPPVTARDFLSDVISGAAGGIAGEITRELGANVVVIGIVTAFVAGFVAEALFPGAPIQPRALEEEALPQPCAG